MIAAAGFEEFAVSVDQAELGARIEEVEAAITNEQAAAVG